MLKTELENTNVTRAKDYLSGLLTRFMPTGQIEYLENTLLGEEAQGIADLVNRIAGIIENMPKTYETDGQGKNAFAHLHYFKGCYDAWISEKDMEADQLQAFGYASFYGPDEAEAGYVSITDAIRNGVELDLHFNPCPLREIV